MGKACELINNADIQRMRNTSETKEKIYSPKITASGTADPSSLLRNRKRTVSKDSEPHIREMVQSVLKDKEETKLTSKGESHSLTPKRTCVLLNDPAQPTEKVKLQFQEVSLPPQEKGEGPSLTFLGESRSGLMANSMVNLSRVGLNEEIVDQETNAILAHDSSPEASPSPLMTQSDYGISLSTTDSTSALQIEVVREGHSSHSGRPFTSTQSCPCLGEIQGQNDFPKPLKESINKIDEQQNLKMHRHHQNNEK